MSVYDIIGAAAVLGFAAVAAWLIVCLATNVWAYWERERRGREEEQTYKAELAVVRKRAEEARAVEDRAIKEARAEASKMPRATCVVLYYMEGGELHTSTTALHPSVKPDYTTRIDLGDFSHRVVNYEAHKFSYYAKWIVVSAKSVAQTFILDFKIPEEDWIKVDNSVMILRSRIVRVEFRVDASGDAT